MTPASLAVAPDRIYTYAEILAELVEARKTEAFLFAEIDRLQQAVLETAIARRKDAPCAHCSR